MNMKKKSEFLSALGTGNEIFKRIVHGVLNMGGDDDDLRKLISCSEDQLRLIAYNILRPRFLQNGFPIFINWTYSLENYLGFFDQVGSENSPSETTDRINKDIMAGGPTGTNITSVNVRLLHLNQNLDIKSPEEMSVTILGNGKFRFASILELATFGGSYPIEQLFCPICTVINPNETLIPNEFECMYLLCNRGKRVIDYQPDHFFNNDVRFLVVVDSLTIPHVRCGACGVPAGEVVLSNGEKLSDIKCPRCGSNSLDTSSPII
jgi:hypothetical protein